MGDRYTFCFSDFEKTLCYIIVVVLIFFHAGAKKRERIGDFFFFFIDFIPILYTCIIYVLV